MGQPDKYELVAELARRRGFFWPSFEIYGGVSGFIDYGPLGIALRRKIEQKWRSFFVDGERLLEIDTPIIVPAKIFQISGHVDHFKDPVVTCTSCSRAFRADHLLKEAGLKIDLAKLDELANALKERMVRCPECGGKLSELEQASTMFKTTIGTMGDSVGYGRPETAQGMFVDFRRLHELSRGRIPLGIAQIGRGLRNEISPRQGPVRLREFNMMEFEFFFDPEDPQCTRFSEVENEQLSLVPTSRREKGTDDPVIVDAGTAVSQGYIINKWLAYFMVLSKRFVSELGIAEDRQRFHEKLPEERAHYARQTYDHEVLLDRWGWVELAGHAYRGDFDLSAHMSGSGVDLRVFKPYEEPKVSRVRIVKANMPAIARDFRNETSRIAQLISSMDPDASEKALKLQGYVQVEKYRLRPDHISILVDVREEKGKRFIPHVVEPSFGADRILYATMEHAYARREDRLVLQLPRNIAPIDVIVLPLMPRDGLREKASEVHLNLRQNKLNADYDESGSVGRRYARADEIGVPLAVTVDYDTLENDTVTLRDRDSWNQVRAECNKLPQLVHEFLEGKRDFVELGVAVTP